MKVKRCLQFVLLILLANQLFAQQATPTEICSRFFEKYGRQSSDSALTYLFTTNKFASRFPEQTEDLRLKLHRVIDGSGRYFSNELVTTKTAGKSVVMLTFVVNHEIQPIIFRISFYRPQDSWQVMDFKFTTKVEDELEEASRVDRLRENIDFQ